MHSFFLFNLLTSQLMQKQKEQKFLVIILKNMSNSRKMGTIRESLSDDPSAHEENTKRA